MAYWLFKSEPGAWSWDDQVAAGTAEWDGIRNYQADNNMKAMKVGDKAFFYHSVEERRIVGVVKVARTQIVTRQPRLARSAASTMPEMHTHLGKVSRAV